MMVFSMFDRGNIFLVKRYQLIINSYNYYNSAIIQELGTHVVFVTMYANGLVPLVVGFIFLSIDS